MGGKRGLFPTIHGSQRDVCDSRSGLTRRITGEGIFPGRINLSSVQCQLRMPIQSDHVPRIPRACLIDHRPGALLSRTGIMTLSAMLLGMSVGQEMPHDAAALSGCAGLFGFAASLALHLVACRRQTDRVNATVERVNDRFALNAAAIDDPLPALVEAPEYRAPPELGVHATEIAFAIHQRRIRRCRNLRRSR